MTLDFVELSAVFQFGDVGIDKNVIRRKSKIDHLSYFYLFFEPPRFSVQGVKSLGGHFACLCREFDFYEAKKIYLYIIIFQKEKGNTFTLSIIFIVKSLQKKQNSTNLLHTITSNMPA